MSRQPINYFDFVAQARSTGYSQEDQLYGVVGTRPGQTRGQFVYDWNAAIKAVAAVNPDWTLDDVTALLREQGWHINSLEPVEVRY